MLKISERRFTIAIFLEIPLENLKCILLTKYAKCLVLKEFERNYVFHNPSVLYDK